MKKPKNIVNNEKNMQSRPQSLFGTTTWKGLLIVAFAAAFPYIGEIAKRSIDDPRQKANVESLVGMIGAVMTAGGIGVAAKGRIDANGPVYTPPGFYGPNIEDLEPIEAGSNEKEQTH